MVQEEIGKITFEDDTDQKAVITIIGNGRRMESANIKFFPKIEGDSSSVAAHLAMQFVYFLSEK